MSVAVGDRHEVGVSLGTGVSGVGMKWECH